MRNNLVSVLTKIKACAAAIDWAETQQENSLDVCWLNCPNGFWLIWILEHPNAADAAYAVDAAYAAYVTYAAYATVEAAVAHAAAAVRQIFPRPPVAVLALFEEQKG